MKRILLSTVLLAAAAGSSAAQNAPRGQPLPPMPSVAAVRADSGRLRYNRADVDFMSGMISHHAQAVQMAGWAPSHGASASVQTLCERIVVAQNDEIVSMQRWLRDRHETVPAPDPRGHMMAGMDHPMLMPGMLTAEQMAQLDAARGVEFDRLFLRFMIQHHQGALSMVDQLFGTNGAAQDEGVYKFASDVSADQSTEIDRMTLMLNALPPGGRP